MHPAWPCRVDQELARPDDEDFERRGVPPSGGGRLPPHLQHQLDSRSAVEAEVEEVVLVTIVVVV